MTQPTPIIEVKAARLYCSFCCRSAEDVGFLCAGPVNAAICAECAITALEAIGTDVRKKIDLYRAMREPAEAQSS